jgi:hypothetical protein
MKVNHVWLPQMTLKIFVGIVYYFFADSVCCVFVIVLGKRIETAFGYGKVPVFTEEMLEDALFCSPKEFLTARYGFMHFGFFVSFGSVNNGNNGSPRIRILLFQLKNRKNLRVMLFVNLLTSFLKGH